MSDSKRDYDEELWYVMSALADSVEEVPGHELVEDLQEAGKDPDVVAARTKSVLLEAVRSHRQLALTEARRRYSTAVDDIQRHSHAHQPTPFQDQRTLLAGVLGRDPQIGRALTIQFRDFKSVDELSDSEVESALRQLSALGFLNSSDG